MWSQRCRPRRPGNLAAEGFRLERTGKRPGVRLNSVIHKRIRRRGEGFQLAADVDAVVAANVNEDSGTNRASSTRSAVQGPTSKSEQEKEG